MELLFVGIIALFFVPKVFKKKFHRPRNNRIEKKDTVTQKRIEEEHSYTERELTRAKKSAIDAVYKKCEEMSSGSEVVYFSLEDIRAITNELKKEEGRR